MGGKMQTKRLGDGITYAILVSLALIMMVPLLWALTTSIKPPEEVITRIPHIVPKNPTLSNYREIFRLAPFHLFLLNSILIGSVSTVSILFFASLGGFVFAKYSFPGKNMLFFIIILGTMMVPIEAYVVRLFLLANTMGWINTYQGLVLPLLIHSTGTFFMRQFISTIPDELLEAARIDGCSEFRIYWQIIIPLSKPALGAVAIIAFVEAWALFIWPLVVVDETRMFTTEIGLTMFQKRFYMEYAPLMAAAIFSVFPVLVVFFTQRRALIRTSTLTGLKF